MIEEVMVGLCLQRFEMAAGVQDVLLSFRPAVYKDSLYRASTQSSGTVTWREREPLYTEFWYCDLEGDRTSIHRVLVL